MALLTLLAAPAVAADILDTEALDLDLGGDVKTFFVASFPYDHAIFLTPPSDPAELLVFTRSDAYSDPAPDVPPSGQGIADFRLKLDLRALGWLRFQAHSAVTAQAPGALEGLSSAGVGLSADEAVDLTWNNEQAEALALQSRVDRLWLGYRGSLGESAGLDVTLGRQPITFGKALFFTPLDLVNPFTPAVIDQEYKPGVDALRADLYLGMSTQLTAAAAYAGSWDRQGMIAAGYGQTTIGLWDLGLFAGSVRGDSVLGLSAAGSAGPVGLYGEGSWTDPAAGGEEPFVRAAAGASWLPGPRTSLAGELYLQTLGVSDPHEYLLQQSGERYSRGELWLAGRVYAGLSLSQEIRPTLTGALAGVLNLQDGSAFVSPTLAWSIADEAALAAGAFFGLGARPTGISWESLLQAGSSPEAILAAVPVNSEFGLVPATGFLQLKAYF